MQKIRSFSILSSLFVFLSACTQLSDLTTPASSSSVTNSGAAYSVIYKGNGSTAGTVPTDAATYRPNAIVSLASAGSLEKAGYYFEGWRTGPSSGTFYEAGGTMIMPTGSISLYASWGVPHSVTYHGNGNTAGSVPTDSSTYRWSESVTVLGNTGGLEKTGSGGNYYFVGWNTKADGTGTTYAAGSSFRMARSNVSLYAVWSENVKYVVNYVGNGNSGGAVPTDGNYYDSGSTVTVLGNSGNLVKTGYMFSGWNTTAAGGGTSYAVGSNLIIGTENIVLYAQWTATKRFVAVGTNGTVYTSTDGISWNADSGPGGAETLMSVVYGSSTDRIVACGTSGYAYYSTDGTSWSQVPTGAADTLTAIAYGDALYVACAQTASRAYYSSDGVNWSESVVALEGYDITYGNGYFLMGGNGGWSGYGTAVEVETDSWNSIGPMGSFNYYGYTYGNSVYVGVTVNGNIDVSDAGSLVSWSNKLAAGIQLNAVVYGNGCFVAVGNSGTIYHSSDSGQSWTSASSPVSNDLYEVCYGDGKFVAVGAGGAIIYSTNNGANWTAASSPGSADLQGICFRP